jgi:hypothetical protein
MSRPVAPRVAGAIGRLGGGFMISRWAKAAAEANDLQNPWAAYFTGRAGVLGEVDADVVLASLVFWHPPTLRAAWAERTAKGIPATLATERFREANLSWGRAKLAALADDKAVRLADLLERVGDAADPLCAPVFAGWRAQPRPEAGDDRARVSLAAHVLREHRMAVHAVAVRAAQMDPLDAILAGAGGPGNAAFFGWPEPYPDVTHLAAQRAEVEALTDRLAESAYTDLSEEDAEDLVVLANEAAQLSYA